MQQYKKIFHIHICIHIAEMIKKMILFNSTFSELKYVVKILEKAPK